jgi:hypothetical protein
MNEGDLYASHDDSDTQGFHESSTGTRPKNGNEDLALFFVAGAGWSVMAGKYTV